MERNKMIEQLRNADIIVIPKLFSYWSHSSQYKVGESNSSRKGVWESLPTDEITVKSEMSFLFENQRMQYASEYKSLSKIPTSYAPDSKDENLRGFQIKVIMPKYGLSVEELAGLNKSDEEIKSFRWQTSGLGDGRHPKLVGQTKLVVIGFMKHDEMSGKQVDTVICVRDEDLECYYDCVKEEISQARTIAPIKYDKPESDYYKVGSEKITRVLGHNEYKTIGKELKRETVLEI